MSPLWRLELFGGLRAIRENELVDRFRTQKTAALLAYFALKPGPQPREVLINLLWPEAEPEAARNSLSASLSSLRRQLEPELSPGSVLLSTRASAGLQPEAFVCDVAEFEAALKVAERAKDDGERIEALARVVEIYSGPLLPGFYDDWLAAEARRREEEFSESLGDLLDLLDDAQDWERIVGFARHGLSLLPMREEWHLALMRAHQMLGKPDAALRQFEELRAVLLREGGEPSPKAKRLAIEAQSSRDAKRLAEASQESPSPESAPLAQEVAAEPSSAAVTIQTQVVEQAVPIAPPIPIGPRTFLMVERPSGAREQEFIGRELEKHGGRLERQTADRMLWSYERCEDAAQGATGVQVGLATLPPDERLRTALCIEENPVGHGGASEATLERLRVLLQGAHAGQVLCDERSAELLRAAKMPLLDLGRYRLVGSVPERLFQLEYPAAPAFAPPRLTAAAASHLPPQFTRFFGREAEIQHLHRLLSQENAPLITLLGPGGSGKTRLAIEAARTLGDDRFSIYFVPLADISGESFVFPAIRDAMKLPTLTGVSPRDQLFEALATRPTLIILDNFEQLVEEGAHCVQELLGASPLLRLIVTSRQMLNLPGEREFPVPPLPVPEEDTSALLLKEISSAALFIDRAQASRVDFRVDERNAPYIAAICQRLDGIPLALELAAARSLVLSPAQMLEKLRDRLDILSTRQRGVPERHRTLRTAIEWSYSLLSPELQQFFAALSVFRGGWTLEAAEAVCEEIDALDFLTRLRECSLVVTQERGEETRFRMLETLREYAATQLKPDQLSHREQLYAAYFGQLAENAEPHLRGPQQASWLERLESEQDNFRAVLSWTLEHNPNAALRLAAALSPFWETRGHYAEGRDWLEKALALHSSTTSSRNTDHESAPESSSVRAQALGGAGWMSYYATDFDVAEKQLEESLMLSRRSNDRRGAMQALAGLASRATLVNDFAAMRAHASEALALFRSMDSLDERASVVSMLAKTGLVVLHGGQEGDIDLAQTLCEEVVSIARLANNKLALALGLIGQGAIANLQRDFETARFFLEEGMALSRELNEPFYTGYGFWNLGRMAQGLGDLRQARAFHYESQALGVRYHMPIGFPYVLESLAQLALAEGQPAQAATLLGTAHSLREKTHAPVAPLFAPEVEAATRDARTALGDAIFSAKWKEGQNLTAEAAFDLAFEPMASPDTPNVEENSGSAPPLGIWAEPEASFEAASPAVARGRALCSAGRLAWFESELDGARTLLEKGLAILRGAGDEIGVINAVSSLSMVLSWQGDSEGSTRLLKEGLKIVGPFLQRADLLPVLANFGWALSFSFVPETLDDVNDINRRVVELARVANDQRSLAWALDGLGQCAFWRGDWPAARRMATEAISLFQSFDERFGKAHSSWVVSVAARQEKDFVTARRYNEQSLTLLMGLKNRVGVPYILENFAYIAIEEAQFLRGALLLGAVQSARELLNPRQTLVAIEHERYVEILRSCLDTAAFEAAWERGRRLSIDEACTTALRAPDEEQTFEVTGEGTTPAIARGRALCSAGRLAWFESELDSARILLEKGLAVLRPTGDEVGIVNAIGSLSMVLSWQGEEDTCFNLLQEGLRIVRSWEWRPDLLPPLANFGWAVSFSSLPQMIDEARDVNMEVVKLARLANDRRSLAWALDSLSQNFYWRNDWASSRRFVDEAVMLFEQLDERFGTSHSIWVRGNALRREGRYDQARRDNEKSLALMLQLKNRVGVPYILESFAYLAIEEGYPERAALLLGAAQTARELTNPRQSLVLREYNQYLELLRAQLDEHTLASTWERGRELSLEDALAEARRGPDERRDVGGAR